MSTTIISANPTFKKEKPNKGGLYLNVAEYFSDTIQGEGVSMGFPATFLRLQSCTLNCTWCDTTEVWRQGNPYSLGELFELTQKVNQNHRFVITGGSPLLQQETLIKFLIFWRFSNGNNKLPYIEIENECVVKPSDHWSSLDLTKIQWNNSPKLSNSGMKESIRYKPEVIKRTSILLNSWFKFVVSDKEDIEEIETKFLLPKLIKEEQVILMPCGSTREELNSSREWVIEQSVKNGWRYSDRLHVVAWDKKTGV